MPALAELEREWVGARARIPPSARGSTGCSPPTSAARRRSTTPSGSRSASGRAVYLKREDLLHTGAHKINNALGQALLAKRMGKQRVIAETGAGQHGVATATACALLGLECVVYMGTEDMRRQRPNVERMGLLGARGGAGRGRRAHAQGGGQRGDPRLGHERRDDALRDRLGGRPGPVPGAGARPPAGDRRRGARPDARDRRARLPDRVVACVGGGSNAIGTFVAFVGDEAVELVGVEAARRGARRSGTARRLPPGARACCTARCPRSSRTRTGRSSRRTRSPPGLDYPGVGPEHAHLRDTGRVRYESVTDDEALAAFRELSRLEGIIPALEPAHAIAWVLAQARPPAERHARDAQRPRRQGPRRGPVRARCLKREPSPTRRASGSRPRSRGTAAGRADAVPDGRLSHPSPSRSRWGESTQSTPISSRSACLSPIRSPTGRRSRPRASARSRRERRSSGCSTRSRRRSPSEVPVVVMCYANPILARGFERVAGALARARRVGPDRARHAGRRGGRAARRLRRGRHRAGSAGRADHAARRACERIAEAARGFVYVVSVTGVTGERAALPPRARRGGGAGARGRDVPVAVGFGVGTPEQVAEVGEIADGVIVGSRLVRAVAEAPTLDAGPRGRPRLPRRSCCAPCGRRLDCRAACGSSSDSPPECACSSCSGRPAWRRTRRRVRARHPRYRGPGPDGGQQRGRDADRVGRRQRISGIGAVGSECACRVPGPPARALPRSIGCRQVTLTKRRDLEAKERCLSGRESRARRHDRPGRVRRRRRRRWGEVART